MTKQFTMCEDGHMLYQEFSNQAERFKNEDRMQPSWLPQCIKAERAWMKWYHHKCACPVCGVRGDND